MKQEVTRLHLGGITEVLRILSAKNKMTWRQIAVHQVGTTVCLRSTGSDKGMNF